MSEALPEVAKLAETLLPTFPWPYRVAHPVEAEFVKEAPLVRGQRAALPAPPLKSHPIAQGWVGLPSARHAAGAEALLESPQFAVTLPPMTLNGMPLEGERIQLFPLRCRHLFPLALPGKPGAERRLGLPGGPCSNSVAALVGLHFGQACLPAVSFGRPVKAKLVQELLLPGRERRALASGMVPSSPLPGYPAAQQPMAPLLWHVAMSPDPAEFAKLGIALLPLRFIRTPIKPETLQQVPPLGAQPLSRTALAANPTGEGFAAGLGWDDAMAVPALEVRECAEPNHKRKIPAEVKVQT